MRSWKLSFCGILLIAFFVQGCGVPPNSMRGRLGNQNSAFPRQNTTPSSMNGTHAAPANSNGPFDIIISDSLEDHIRSFEHGSAFNRENSCFRTYLPLDNIHSEVGYYATACRNVRKGMTPALSFIPVPISNARNTHNNVYRLMLKGSNLDIGEIQGGFRPGSVGDVGFGRGSNYNLVKFCSDPYPCKINFLPTGGLRSLEQF
jgi:hypothetical protein